MFPIVWFVLIAVMTLTTVETTQASAAVRRFVQTHIADNCCMQREKYWKCVGSRSVLAGVDSDSQVGYSLY